MSFKTIDDLRNSKNIITDFLSDYRKLGELWMPLDIFVISILNRMSAINDAFNELTSDSEDSGVAAFPLIRLQIDNLIYCYAGTLVDDIMELLGCFVAGNNWSSLKDKNGNDLKESYLIDGLCEKMGSTVFKMIYKRSSNYIHLSTEHIGITLSKSGNEAIKTTIDDNGTYYHGFVTMMLVLNQALLKILTENYAYTRARSHEILQEWRLEYPTLSDLDILDKYGYSNDKFKKMFYRRLRPKE